MIFFIVFNICGDGIIKKNENIMYNNEFVYFVKI